MRCPSPTRFLPPRSTAKSHHSHQEKHQLTLSEISISLKVLTPSLAWLWEGGE